MIGYALLMFLSVAVGWWVVYEGWRSRRFRRAERDKEPVLYWAGLGVVAAFVAFCTVVAVMLTWQVYR
jgi:hypothetical protein